VTNRNQRVSGGLVMLVLSRKENEQLVIANEIVVTVVEIRGDKVRLGIEADAKIPVHRREIQDLVDKQGVNNGEG
jgi:carbon storage regulator